MNETIQRADALYLAREMMTAAHALILAAVTVDGKPDGNAKAYVADHLRILTDAEHGFLSRGTTVDALIDHARGGDYGYDRVQISDAAYDAIRALDDLIGLDD